MNFILLVAILFFPTLLLACSEVPPGVVFEPLNTVEPIFTRRQGLGSEGKAKAVLSVNELGEVVGVELVSVEPENLDKNPIIKAFEKTKFTKGYALENYIYIIEFHILEVSS